MQKKSKGRLSRIEKKVDEVLKLEKRQIKEEKLLKKGEDEVTQLEKQQLKVLASEEEELKKIEQFEKEIRREVGSHPLTKITIKDVGKGMIGAFIGIVSHYAFLEGARVAEESQFTYVRATVLLISAFILGLIFMYATGFRKVKETTLIRFFPLRVLFIYGISILAIFIVLSLYGIINVELGFGALDFGLIYKQVASISIPAIIGASAADLIGGE